MADRKLRPTSFDYALAALAPVLIILMIGSLVYFLITTLYRGDFHARLMWILGLFTMASVLVTRIAIEQSRTQSLTYLGLLSAATLLVAPRFFVLDGFLAPLSIPILIGFLALIVFLADRITMDCTSVDDAQDSHGYGLLQSLGFFKRSENSPTSGSQESIATEKNQSQSSAKSRNHNPGVWILYFALLALPVFGLGQFFLPSGPAQRVALVCLVIYLSSALALLVMISLLSLRQYVRQRDVEMDSGMTWTWLASGIGSVLGLVILMSILPLPMLGESSWQAPFTISSPENMSSSKWGWGNEGVQQQPSNQPNGNQAPVVAQGQQGQPSSQQTNPSSTASNSAQPTAQPGQQEPSKGPSQGASSSAPSNRPQQGPPSSQGSPEGQQGPTQGRETQQPGKSDRPAMPSDPMPSDPMPSQSSGKPSTAQQGTPPGQQVGPQSPGQQQSPKQPSTNQQASAEPTKSSENRQPENNSSDEQSPDGANRQEQADRDRSGENQQSNDRTGNQNQSNQVPSPPKPSPPPKPNPTKSDQQSWTAPSISWNLSASLRWLLIAILAVVALVFGAKHFRAWLAWLTTATTEQPQAVDAAPIEADPLVRFSQLQDPFEIHRHDPNAIVRSLFQAVSIWGREHRVARGEDETPDEYSRRLGRKYAEIAEPLTQLGLMVSRLAYANKSIQSRDALSLQSLWVWLKSH